LKDEPDGPIVVTSPSDLKLLSDCEFAFARTLDLKLGRLAEAPVDDDGMLTKAGALGDAHETARLSAYRDEFAGGVVEIARPANYLRDGLRAAAAATDAALRGGAPVVFQATFFDETDPDAPTVGFADFLVRRPDGRYRVQDTKLARSVKVTALLQLAAYHGHLVRLGVPVDDTVELLLGDGRVSAHPVDEVAPVFELRQQRLRHVVAARIAASGPAEWGDDTLAVDGRCVHCAAEVEAHDDLLRVAGIRVAQRAKLREAGITTMTQLAATATRPSDCAVPARTYRVLQSQAALQVQGPDAAGRPPVEFHTPGAIADLPLPSPGDLFFDFEGDPLWRGERDGQVLWNLDYLFGVVDTAERFTAFWAHDLEAEKRALVEFLAWVRERREAHPDLHIYHYASYERTHLLSIAARHGVGEREVDQLLRDNVLVDLYPLVKRALRVGTASYSIKKLEPLYMGADLRDAEGVTSALGSVEEYWRARELELAGDRAGADAVLTSIADYNEYDCRSTLRLRDWLLRRAAEQGVYPGATPIAAVDRAPFEESPLALQLEQRAARLDDLVRAGAAEPLAPSAFRLAAAAIDYHRREDKSFWWEHYARLSDPEELWVDQRGVFRVESGEVDVDWAPARTRWSRTLRLRGAWAPGSGAAPDDGDAFAVYDAPPPFLEPGRPAGSRVAVGISFAEQTADSGEVRVVEFCRDEHEPWSQLPEFLTPGGPPRAGGLKLAIEEFGHAALAAGDEPPLDAAGDVLMRRPPRLVGGGVPTAPIDPEGIINAVIATTLRLDRSALAVQGPPGTGKTYVGAHVIAALVREHGWKIGVVAQSHRVVEHLLDEVVTTAGLDAAAVGKAPSTREGRGAYAANAFTELAADGQSRFAADHALTGYVIGGTAWDFVNLRRIQRGQLDLLVIDEAGRFSLAATIAAAASARNLLLLGDPQQLPQVSQGIHPVPVDGSALGHLGAGHDVLPAELGYFLPESRRLHPALSAVVSRLSYEGRLGSHASAGERRLEGVEPGLHPLPVAHDGDATESLAEADAVVALVARLLGSRWSDPGRDVVRRALTTADVIVVTPYNAQLQLIRARLEAAGLGDVRVGTVDRFQGQEAVVSIVSLAASSADDVPRGLDFLLSRNRLNVAVSRAQWAAYLLFSARLLEHLPGRPDGFAQLSRFIDLVRPPGVPRPAD
jgi:predicted RecB family nuclease